MKQNQMSRVNSFNLNSARVEVFGRPNLLKFLQLMSSATMMQMSYYDTETVIDTKNWIFRTFFIEPR